MPVYRLPDEPIFPPVEEAEDGLLAVGGDLSPERLVAAYASGIFPWYTEGDPILWHAPDPRCVLPTDALHVPRRLRRTLAGDRFRVTWDREFEAVVRACAAAPRRGQHATWITPAMADAYVELHRRGLAHSVETRDRDGRLVGGLYGVSLGDAFFGESMFAAERDASKVALVRLVERMRSEGMPLLDCQVETPHLRRFGARGWSRRRFMDALRECLARPTRIGPWTERSGDA